MFAIFTQDVSLTWRANAATLDEARSIAADFRDQTDFAIIVPCAAFLNFDDATPSAGEMTTG